MRTTDNVLPVVMQLFVFCLMTGIMIGLLLAINTRLGDIQDLLHRTGSCASSSARIP